MKRLLLLLLFFLHALLINAQVLSTEDMTVTLNNPLIFSYNNIDELQQPKVISNAIEIRLTYKGYTRNILASVHFNNTQLNTLPPDWLALRLARKGSNNAIISSYTVPLTETPTLLFTQQGALGGNDYNSISYDLLLSPMNTFIKTGSYNFSILITSVAP